VQYKAGSGHFSPERCPNQVFMTPTDLQPQIRTKENGKALTFCGNLILRVGDFVCFAGTNSSDWKRVLFLAGINFCDFH